MDLNLPLQGDRQLGLFELALGQLLHGKLDAGGFMQGAIDVAIGTLADLECLVDFQIRQLHIGQELIVIAILSCSLQLATSDERSGAFEAFSLNRWHPCCQLLALFEPLGAVLEDLRSCRCRLCLFGGTGF